jgi:hypothetical protein
VIAGAEDAGRAFSREAFQIRRDEMTASRRALDQTVEVVTLQETPRGSLICVYLEGADPVEGNRAFAASVAPFDVWFKAHVATLFRPRSISASPFHRCGSCSTRRPCQPAHEPRSKKGSPHLPVATGSDASSV